MRSVLFLVSFLFSTLTLAATTTVTSATVIYQDDGTVDISLTIAGQMVGISPPEPPKPQPPKPRPQPPTGATYTTNTGACAAVGSNLNLAKQSFALMCPTANPSRRDCDPMGGQWVCADGNINRSTTLISSNAPVTPPRPQPAPQPPSDWTTYTAQAENAQLSDGWSRDSSIAGFTGDSYIRWNGGNRFNSKGEGELVYGFNITTAGVYQVSLRSYNTASEVTENNDVWMSTSGGDVSGREPTSGWRKVFMSASKQWVDWINVDNGIDNQNRYFTYFNEGANEVRLSGRSNGYLIDSITVTLSGSQAPTAPNNNGDVSTLGGFRAIPSNITTNDLVALHFDNAPDRDDGHALTANRVLFDLYGFRALAVNGTHGYLKRGEFQQASKPLFSSAWPNGLDAFGDWAGSVETSAAAWSSTIAKGGRVYVAAGGPMDFSADVLRAMPQSQRSSVTIVQHSVSWNEANTSRLNMDFIRANANYVVIADGNGANATPKYQDYNVRPPSFFLSAASSSRWASLWSMAFDYMKPSQRLDFSDTVELLHVLGVPTSEVATSDNFAAKYLL